MNTARTSADRCPLPRVRGPLSAFVLDHLTQPPHRIDGWPAPVDDVVDGDDFQLALYLMEELHYRGVSDVDDAWEWEPSLVGFRNELEGRFEAALRERVPVPAPSGDTAADLVTVIESGGGRSLSKWLETAATAEHFREFVMHRSAYQLKEADPHSWAIPRLHGRPKAALVNIQKEEYGDGIEADMHCSVFARTMRALDLDDSYGAYLDLLPGITLATVNLMTLFGIQRRLRGAIVGHLAVFEMTSTVPNQRYGDGLRRLGFGTDATYFYDIHVEADEDHQDLAAHGMAAGLTEQDPAEAANILFGAAALCAVEAGFAAHLIDSWERGDTSLLRAHASVGAPAAG